MPTARQTDTYANRQTDKQTVRRMREGKPGNPTDRTHIFGFYKSNQNAECCILDKLLL